MHMSMKHIAFVFLLPMACLMACSSHDDINEAVDQPASQGKPLLIEVSETTLTDPEAANANTAMAGSRANYREEGSRRLLFA